MELVAEMFLAMVFLQLNVLHHRHIYTVLMTMGKSSKILLNHDKSSMTDVRGMVKLFLAQCKGRQVRVPQQ